MWSTSSGARTSRSATSTSSRCSGGRRRTGDPPAITERNPDTSAGLFAGFSPRSGGADLQAFIEEITSAERDVLFCTTFDLNDIERALLGDPNDPILRLGLQNSRSQITGYHRDHYRRLRRHRDGAGRQGYLKEMTAGQRAS